MSSATHSSRMMQQTIAVRAQFLHKLRRLAIVGILVVITAPIHASLPQNATAKPAVVPVDRAALLTGIWRGVSDSAPAVYHHRIVVTHEGSRYIGEGLAWCSMTEAQADAAQRGTLRITDFPDLNTNAIRPLCVQQRFEVSLQDEIVTFRSVVREKMVMVVAVRFANSEGDLPSAPIPMLVTRVQEDSLIALAARPEHGQSQPMPAAQRDAYDQLFQRYAPDRFAGRMDPPGFVAQDGTPQAADTHWFRLWREDALATPRPLDLERSKILTLACLEGGVYHYTCYLPRSYDPAVPMPVVINFSPDGDAEPLAPKIAESLGWIMVGLTEARNGPWEPVCANRDAVLFDLRRRFNIDLKRIYFAGMSGGARAAAISAVSYPDACAGALCIGASSKGATPTRNIPLYFLSGETDINRKEIEMIYQAEQAAGRQVALALHPGGHTWGTPEDQEAALRWLAARVSSSH